MSLYYLYLIMVIKSNNKANIGYCVYGIYHQQFASLVIHRTLTSKTINVMKAGWLWETSLVAEAVESFDACLRPSTAHPGGNDGVAHTAIGQPSGAATVQAFTPRQVQLCCCSQLCPCSSAVWLCFSKGQQLSDRVMDHLSCKHNFFFKVFIIYFIVCTVSLARSHIFSWV